MISHHFLWLLMIRFLAVLLIPFLHSSRLTQSNSSSVENIEKSDTRAEGAYTSC